MDNEYGLHQLRRSYVFIAMNQHRNDSVGVPWAVQKVVICLRFLQKTINPERLNTLNGDGITLLRLL